jgi:hypothetical protein
MVIFRCPQCFTEQGSIDELESAVDGKVGYGADFSPFSMSVFV